MRSSAPPCPSWTTVTGTSRGGAHRGRTRIRALPELSGATAVFALAVRAGAGTPPGRPRELAAESAERSEHRLARALARVPRLSSDIPGLAAYWRGSLASGLVCLWDNPGFITSPFVATSGVDGGALCAYAWDTGGYAPHLLTLMLGESTGTVTVDGRRKTGEVIE
ncbi:hypothetical protein AB0L53_41260 [Nonomuraea sp. NPDC052129]|uniref:hypothetical protein n=1 Tax=Nonomuraea sp. NPDC052129 TaxID=3154651 RepID=UPI003442DDFA